MGEKLTVIIVVLIIGLIAWAIDSALTYFEKVSREAGVWNSPEKIEQWDAENKRIAADEESAQFAQPTFSYNPSNNPDQAQDETFVPQVGTYPYNSPRKHWLFGNDDDDWNTPPPKPEPPQVPSDDEAWITEIERVIVETR
jgi:hypothetical protein